MDKAEGFLQPGNFLELNNSLLLLLLLLLSHVWVFGIPGKHARLPCPSPTPGACSNSHPLSQWCHLTISSSVVPLSSHLQSFPASGSFPVSQFFAPGGQRIGVSASTSVLPVNIQGWSTSTLTKFWMGKSKVEFGERDITLVSMSCLFLLMSLETESRNIERKDTLMVQEGSVCCSRHLGVPESLDIFSGVWKRDHRAYNGRGECVTAECRGCYYIFNVWLKLSEINCQSRMRQRPTFFVLYYWELLFFFHWENISP